VVGKPFGVRGHVYVRPDPDFGGEFEPEATYDTGDGRTLVVAEGRLHSGRRVVRFDGVTDRVGAEALRGTVLHRNRAEIPLEEGAFWVRDLVGREVVDDAGDLVGVVEAVEDGAAHDYLVVARPDGGEVLIPAVDGILDVSGGRVVVHPIPGLLDGG
jgi:16S rRNA processing protein RimM